MVNLVLADDSILNVQIDWTTPGGAGGVREAQIRGVCFVDGRDMREVSSVKFIVSVEDDATGADEDLRRRAYALILPALRKFRHAAGNAPLTIAPIHEDVIGRRTTVRMVVASKDGKRAVAAEMTLPVRPEETHEDRVYRLAPVAFRMADRILRNLEAVVGPVPV